MRVFRFSSDISFRCDIAFSRRHIFFDSSPPSRRRLITLHAVAFTLPSLLPRLFSFYFLSFRHFSYDFLHDR